MLGKRVASILIEFEEFEDGVTLENVLEKPFKQLQAVQPHASINLVLVQLDLEFLTVHVISLKVT